MLTSLIRGTVGILALASTLSAAVVVEWTGSTDFDDEIIEFSPFVANQLTLVDGAGGFMHDHSNTNTTFSLDIFLDGNWTTIWSVNSGNSSDIEFEMNLSDIPAPITFAMGTVSALRLRADPAVADGFHCMNSSCVEEFDADVALDSHPTSFTFDTAGDVPEPSTVALMAAGLGGVAIARRRRRAA